MPLSQSLPPSSSIFTGAGRPWGASCWQSPRRRGLPVWVRRWWGWRCRCLMGRGPPPCSRSHIWKKEKCFFLTELVSQQRWNQSIQFTWMSCEAAGQLVLIRPCCRSEGPDWHVLHHSCSWQVCSSVPVISTVLFLEGCRAWIALHGHGHHLKTNTVLPAGTQTEALRVSGFCSAELKTSCSYINVGSCAAWPGSSELDEQRSWPLHVNLIDWVVFVWIFIVPTASSAGPLPLAVNLKTDTQWLLTADQYRPHDAFCYALRTRLVWVKGFGILEKVNLHPEYTFGQKEGIKKMNLQQQKI